MTFVIAEPCIGTKDTACVDVCPTGAIPPLSLEEKQAAVIGLALRAPKHD